VGDVWWRFLGTTKLTSSILLLHHLEHVINLIIHLCLSITEYFACFFHLFQANIIVLHRLLQATNYFHCLSQSSLQLISLQIGYCHGERR
jgi:hypothetical protein